jgi:hypothetical protein
MKLYIILILTILFSKTSFSQKDSAFIDYDFSNGKLVATNPNFHPSVYKPIVFRIRNINRAIFKIKIETKDSILASSNPQGLLGQITGFTPVTIPTKTATNIKNETDANNKKDGTNKIKLNQIENTQLNTNIENNSESDEISASFFSLDNFKKNSDEIASKITLASTEIEIKNNKPNVLSLGKSISANRYYQNEIQQLNKVITEINTQNRNLIGLQIALKNELLTSENYNSFIDLEKEKKKLNKYKLQLEKIETHKVLIGDLGSILQEILVDTTINQTVKNVFKSYQKYLDTTVVSLKLDSLVKRIFVVEEILKSIEHKEFFTFVSGPYIPFGDLVTFKVIVESADAASLTIDNRKTFELPMFTKNRFRFDFSTGLSFIGGLTNSSFKTEPYFRSFIPPGGGSSIQVSTDSFSIKENTRNEKVIPTICAFVHAGFDIGGQWKPVFTFGASLNTTDFDISTIVLGAGLMIGRSERFIISGGWAFKKIEVLDPKFVADVNTPYKKSFFANEAVPIVKEFRSGWFLSVSYNLTNKSTK